MNEMMERATKAVADAAWYRGLDLTDYSDYEEELSAVLARAAIKAMREPGDGMVSAGQRGQKEFHAYLTAESVVFRYQAMIDAALEDPKDAQAK